MLRLQGRLHIIMLKRDHKGCRGLQEALEAEAAEEAEEGSQPKSALKPGLGGTLQRGLDWVGSLLKRKPGASLLLQSNNILCRGRGAGVWAPRHIAAWAEPGQQPAEAQARWVMFAFRINCCSAQVSRHLAGRPQHGLDRSGRPHVQARWGPVPMICRFVLIFLCMLGHARLVGTPQRGSDWSDRLLSRKPGGPSN